MYRIFLSIIFLSSSFSAGLLHAYEFEDPSELDHRDQWGFGVQGGAVFVSSTITGGMGAAGVAGMVELGLSRGVAFTGNEFSVRIRSLFAHEEMGFMLLGGYRVYAGIEHWKSFADVDLVIPLNPGPAIGMRLGGGLLYDLNRSVGFSLAGGAFGAIGVLRITGFDVFSGVQFRFD